MIFNQLPTLFFIFSIVTHVSGLSISLGGALGNITARQLLEFPLGPDFSTCEPQCNMANYTIINCGDNDECTCSRNTAELFMTCEQCLFEQIVDLNIKVPDPRFGSNPTLAAFVSACQSSINASLSNIALTLPASWDGSRNVVLNGPSTFFAVGFGGVLGIFSIFLFVTM